MYIAGSATTSGETKMSKAEVEMLLQQAIDAKRQLETRIAELRAATR